MVHTKYNRYLSHRLFKKTIYTSIAFRFKQIRISIFEYFSFDHPYFKVDYQAYFSSNQSNSTFDLLSLPLLVAYMPT